MKTTDNNDNELHEIDLDLADLDIRLEDLPDPEEDFSLNDLEEMEASEKREAAERRSARKNKASEKTGFFSRFRKKESNEDEAFPEDNSRARKRLNRLEQTADSGKSSAGETATKTEILVSEPISASDDLSAIEQDLENMLSSLTAEPDNPRDTASSVSSGTGPMTASSFLKALDEEEKEKDMLLQTTGPLPQQPETEEETDVSRKRPGFRHIGTRVLASVFLVVFAGLIITIGVIYLGKGKSLDMPMTYADTVQAVQTAAADTSPMLAEGFSSGLCVSDANVDLDMISLPDGESGALFDVSDLKVMYAKNMYDKVYPASITKIMTAILCIRNANMSDVVTITEEDVNLEAGSQVVGLQPGDEITMDELFHGLLVYSGNDCAMAIARHLGGSVENFVDMMNQEAAALGATGTHFANPSGLHDDNHYTTVYDIYLMLNEALTYDYFVETMQLPYYTISYTRSGQTVSTYLTATDHYLTGEETAPADVTVLGGKTGTTSAAGNCLAILSQNKYGNPYISVVMNASTKPQLYVDMNTLLSEINS